MTIHIPGMKHISMKNHLLRKTSSYEVESKNIGNGLKEVQIVTFIALMHIDRRKGKSEYERKEVYFLKDKMHHIQIDVKKCN